MFQEHTEDTERGLDVDSRRYHERDWEARRKVGAVFGQIGAWLSI